MSNNNIHALENYQLGPIVIDLAIGLPGLGLDIPTDGFYDPTVSEVNISTAGNNGPSFALTLTGIGNGVRYHYLQIPQLGPDGKPPTEDKALRAYKGAVKGIIGALVAGGIINEEYVASGQTVALSKEHIGMLKGRKLPVHYFAPLPDAVDSNKVDFSTEEILVMTPSMKADASADPTKIKRWKKPKTALTSPGQLGVAVGAVGVGGGVSLPAFGAAPTAAGNLPTMPAAPVQQQPAQGFAQPAAFTQPVGLPTQGAPQLPSGLPPGLQALAGPPA
jgi:hypothetical protein